MIGAETTSLLLGISENLQCKCLAQHGSTWRKAPLLSTEEVPKADDRVLGVFYQLMFCASADILYSASDIRSKIVEDGKMPTVSSPWKEIAEAIWRSPSSLAIQSASPSYNRA